MSTKKEEARTLQERLEHSNQAGIELLTELAKDPTDPVTVQDFKNLLFKMYFFLASELPDVLGEQEHYHVWLLWCHLLNVEEWYREREQVK